MATGSTSSIDLALCSQSIAPHLDWTVLSDLHGSDHFLVIIHISILDLLWNIPHIEFLVWPIGSNFGHPCISLMHLSRMSAMAQHFTDAILTAAKASIPQSSGTARHPPVPWWNPDCAVAIRARKRAFTLLQCHPTMDNLINYKRLRSRARRVIRDSKKSSWRAYISSLTHHTSSREVWHKVRKIKGT